MTFVKLGQVLSTRPDLLPLEFVDELAKLQDDVPAAPWDRVRAVLVEDLGHAPEDVFAEFDEVPPAAASIAQVHLARLKTGEEVVVKVQRPGVRRVAESDLDIVARPASTLQRRTMGATPVEALSTLWKTDRSPPTTTVTTRPGRPPIHRRRVEGDRSTRRATKT